MKLDYSEGFKKHNINAADIFNCLNMLLDDENREFIDCHVLTIKDYEITESTISSLMVNIKIEFIAFYSPNINIYYVWDCHRAKDFSCSSSTWRKVKYVEVV